MNIEQREEIAAAATAEEIEDGAQNVQNVEVETSPEEGSVLVDLSWVKGGSLWHPPFEQLGSIVTGTTNSKFTCLSPPAGIEASIPRRCG